MNNIIFNYIGDKSVSAGENSVIEIDKIHSINSTIGVASKDGSRVDINNSKFTNIKNYSLMTFYKKKFYLKPSINANSIYFEKNKNNFMSQLGTDLIIDNIKQKEIDFDISKIYEK